MLDNLQGSLQGSAMGVVICKVGMDGVKINVWPLQRRQFSIDFCSSKRDHDVIS